MNQDPLLKEIHETRARLLADVGGDMRKLIEKLRSRESEEGSRVVSSESEARPGAGKPNAPSSGRNYRKSSNR